ncbi:MAG TPA: TonB-dependent receptor [Planctomycetota bacterium]|nr:TonB-dependent receptor [Planctomycetota bacterium]
MLQKAFAFLAALTLVTLAGCGGGGTNTPPNTTTPTKTEGTAPKAEKKKPTGGAKEAYAADKHKGSIKGVVLFEGEAARPKINTSGDAKCHAMHEKEPLVSEEFVVKDGKLANVIVHIKGGNDKFSYETPSTPVTVDQKGCQYVPHVFALMVDQPLVFVNSDPLLHNVHGKGKANPEFNISQAQAGQKDTKKLPEPELPYNVGCDVHKWMSAKAGVFDHPFFAVTGADGSFEIKGVPAGDYEVEAWHESMPAQTIKVSVKEDAAEAKFTFKK